MKILKSINLCYEYVRYNDNGGVKVLRALDNINISVEKGSFIAILGHNGSGKSTFAKHINALLAPSSGSLFIKGFDTKNEDFLWDIRQSAGMVFQNPDNQIIATIVEEEIAFGPENLGIDPLEIRQRVNDSLDIVGMGNYKSHSTNLLSGGQKQKISIASILAMNPDCIVFDEPTTMLDPVSRREVIETIKRLNTQNGITIILITHFMDEAVYADKVFVMEDSHVVMEGTPNEIFVQVEKLKGFGLDVPQVTEVAYNLNKAGYNISSYVLTIEELVGELCQYSLKT